jgi:hypothetical protein
MRQPLYSVSATPASGGVAHAKVSSASEASPSSSGEHCHAPTAERAPAPLAVIHQHMPPGRDLVLYRRMSAVEAEVALAHQRKTARSWSGSGRIQISRSESPLHALERAAPAFNPTT